MQPEGRGTGVRTADAKRAGAEAIARRFAALREDGHAPGDMVVLTHAGSYASVLTPMQFSSHDAPRQFLRTCRGDVISLA